MSTETPLVSEPQPSNAHTPLPWENFEEDPRASGCQGFVGSNAEGLEAIVWTRQKRSARDNANMNFIVRACNTYYQRESELQSLRSRIERMEAAATNVLKRWESPNWEWDKHGPTAGIMADLRAALTNK